MHYRCALRLLIQSVTWPSNAKQSMPLWESLLLIPAGAKPGRRDQDVTFRARRTCSLTRSWGPLGSWRGSCSPKIQLRQSLSAFELNLATRSQTNPDLPLIIIDLTVHISVRLFMPVSPEVRAVQPRKHVYPT